MIRPSIDTDLRANRRARRLPRRPFVAAVGLAAILVAGCGSTTSPSPSAAASPAAPSPGETSPSPSEHAPSPSVSPSAPGASPSTPASSPSSADCAAADLRVSGGPWGGAAGSRGADVVVENAGSSACTLPASPVVALADRSGAVVAQSSSSVPGGGPSVNPTGTLTFSLLLGNWCDRTVVPPLQVQLVLTGGTVVVGGLAMASLDQLPPCNGPGQPASLTTTGWTQR